MPPASSSDVADSLRWVEPRCPDRRVNAAQGANQYRPEQRREQQDRVQFTPNPGLAEVGQNGPACCQTGCPPEEASHGADRCHFQDESPDDVSPAKTDRS